MAVAATARRSLASRGLSDLLARRFHPSLTHLLPSDSTRDPRKPAPVPPPPAPRPFHLALTPCLTSQTLNFLPFGLHLLPGPPHRGFSSSSREPDFTDALTDAAHAAAPAAGFPGEVAWAAEDSSTAVAAVQHLIDAVHSSTGLNWWISIALSTVLLRCVVSTLSILGMKRVYLMRQDLLHIPEMVKNLLQAKDGASREKLLDALLPYIKKAGLVVYLPPIVTPYIFITLYIAISNMVEKVPSLKGGGAFWFTDLTTPDGLCIFPMITSLFIMLPLELNGSAVRKCEGCSRKMEKIRWVWRTISLLPMLWTSTLPQAISCSFVTWTSLSLAEKIALRQPSVQKVIFGGPLLKLKQKRCSSCDGQKGPTAKDSPPPVEEHEQPVPPETRKSSDASVHKDESDKNSTKGE